MSSTVWIFSGNFSVICLWPPPPSIYRNFWCDPLYPFCLEIVPDLYDFNHTTCTLHSFHGDFFLLKWETLEVKLAQSPLLRGTFILWCSLFPFLFSRNFINSNWCLQEFYMAFEKVKEGKADFLVPILLEDLSRENLPRDIQTYIKTYT